MSPYLLPFAAALIAFTVGWFASLRWGRPPLPQGSPSLIDALASNVTTQIGYLHDDVLTLHRAVETWSEHSTAAIAALRTDVMARQEEFGVRLTAAEARMVSLGTDVMKLTTAFDRLSAWEPGEELNHPAQLVRFMTESSQDRAGIRREIVIVKDWLRRVAIGLIVLAVVTVPLMCFIAARVLYNMLAGPA